MASHRLSQFVVLLAFLVAVVSVGAGSMRPANAQRPIAKVTLPRRPAFEPLTPERKNLIYSSMHVAKVVKPSHLHYSVRHPFDRAGNLIFVGAADVDAAQDFAILNGGTGTLILNFNPLAVGQKQMVVITVFTTTAGSISMQASAEDASWNAPPETVSLASGTTYLSTVCQPTSSVPVQVILAGFTTSFTFSDVSVELVK